MSCIKMVVIIVQILLAFISVKIKSCINTSKIPTIQQPILLNFQAKIKHFQVKNYSGFSEWEELSYKFISYFLEL